MVLDIRHEEVNSIKSRCLAFASISRAIWGNSVALAPKLFNFSGIARAHTHIVGRKVLSKGHDHFSFASNECHAAVHSEFSGALRSDMTATKPVNKRKQLKAGVQEFFCLQPVSGPLGKTCCEWYQDQPGW